MKWVIMFLTLLFTCTTELRAESGAITVRLYSFDFASTYSGYNVPQNFTPQNYILLRGRGRRQGIDSVDRTISVNVLAKNGDQDGLNRCLALALMKRSAPAGSVLAISQFSLWLSNAFTVSESGYLQLQGTLNVCNM